MRFSIIDNNNFNIYVNNKYLDFSDEKLLYDSLKKILINIKKRYNYDCFGFYHVNIYKIKDFAAILEFNKMEESFISKTIDLKLIMHESNNIYLKFIDFYLINKYKKIKYLNNNFYININDIKMEDFEKLIEYFEIVINKDLNNVDYI